MTGPDARESGPVGRIALLEARYPVAFLPVRIETRFRRGVPANEGLTGELLVRIYPDSILADSHEPLLTANEQAAGEDYWRRAFRDGHERDAWTALLTEARPERAAWIVERTQPTNMESSDVAGPGISESSDVAGRGIVDGMADNVTPVFAPIESRPENWHRAPQARALPERWLVSTFRGGERIHLVFGEPVQEDLALTPRLSTDGDDESDVDITGDGLRIEPALRWAYDFDEAVRAGMGVRIQLGPADLNLGFSTVLVMGVRTFESAEAQATRLAGLLDAHRHSRGLAFVAQGTATNNTSERRSDYPAADLAGTTSFGVARGLALAGPNSDGARLAAALGIDAARFDHVARAGSDEQRGARAMVEALWPATIGYFLDQVLAPEVSATTAAGIREWMRDWVRPRGPLPALRVGAVPYGVLPVTAVSTWQARPDEGVPAVLPGLLGRLMPIARALTGGSPRVGRTGDPDRDLVELLAMDASSRTARIRRSVGYDVAWNAFGLTGRSMTDWDQQRRRLGDDLLTSLGETGRDPRALYLSYLGGTFTFGGPMVAAAPLSETEPLGFDYVAWLRAAAPETLRQQTAPPVATDALLYLMLRHALLTMLDRASRRFLELHNVLVARDVREAELVGIVPTADAGREALPLSTVWERMNVRLPDVTGGRTVGEFLVAAPPESGGSAPVNDVLADLAGYRDALGGLEGLPTAELDRLFTETLDASSHRLDAWVGSLAHRRLASLRDPATGTPAGIWLGCYGWVTDLRPDPPGQRVDVRLPDGTTSSARTDSDGFVYAPSMLHAATAAALRSAYLARSGPGREPYTVDLSSRRVRAALGVLDAVRDGQPLGAVLGYGFERGLHEGHPGVELDRFIDEFRRLWPLVGTGTVPAGETTESLAARNVVDGLRLLWAWRAGQIPWGTGELIPSTAQRAALDAELALLDDAVDAVSDLLLSESVYQVLKGSPAGAAATLASLATGHRPAEPEVVTTPRGGTVLHQRVALLFGSGAPPPAWAAVPVTPRSMVAPELDTWLAGLLGDPSRIECRATPEGGPARTVTLAELGLRPVDLLLSVRAAEAAPADSELDRRVAWLIASATGADAPVALDHDGARPGAVSLAAACEVLAAASRVLGAGRALGADDLLPPGTTTTPPTETGEIDARAAGAQQALIGARAGLAAALDRALDGAAAGAPTPAAGLRTALRAAAAVGVPGAFPASQHTDDPAIRAALVDAARIALSELDTRLAAAASATDAAGVIRAAFGPDLPVIARFRPARSDVLGPALQAEPELGPTPEATVEGWFAQLTRVRPALDAWRDVALYTTALGHGGRRPRIAQLPAGPDTRRWAALPYPDEEARPRSGLVSLALLGAEPPAVDQPWSGLLLDSWPEILPSREEDAGLVFQFDAPAAQAPQAVLLAVPPGPEPTWNYDLLERILLDTLELAKVRALDLADLGRYAQLVPMTFLAANRANATVSTSFDGLLVADATLAQDG